jgi:hypothetical protein
VWSTDLPPPPSGVQKGRGGVHHAYGLRHEVTSRRAQPHGGRRRRPQPTEAAGRGQVKSRARPAGRCSAPFVTHDASRRRIPPVRPSLLSHKTHGRGNADDEPWPQWPEEQAKHARLPLQKHHHFSPHPRAADVRHAPPAGASISPHTAQPRRTPVPARSAPKSHRLATDSAAAPPPTRAAKHLSRHCFIKILARGEAAAAAAACRHQLHACNCKQLWARSPRPRLLTRPSPPRRKRDSTLSVLLRSGRGCVPRMHTTSHACLPAPGCPVPGLAGPCSLSSPPIEIRCQPQTGRGCPVGDDPSAFVTLPREWCFPPAAGTGVAAPSGAVRAVRHRCPLPCLDCLPSLFLLRLFTALNG